MPTTIKGQPTSAEVLRRLADLGEPVFLSFSTGKDSAACWLAMREAGIPVLPVYFYLVPGLGFVDRTLEWYEGFMGQRIVRYPHPSIYRMLEANVFQTPERLPIIDAARLPVPDLDQEWDEIKADFGLPGAWVADGVRASDSIERRCSLVRHGVMKGESRKVSPIADWLKGEVTDFLSARRWVPPVDYELFGRSFDGIDARFAVPIRKRFPEDYETLCEWFPLLPIDEMRLSADAG